MNILRTVLAICLLAGLAGWLSAEEERVPVHRDSEAMERALLDAVRAFLHDDLPAAKDAMDRAALGTRTLKVEEEETYGSGMVNYSRAFQITSNDARELAGRGEVTRSWQHFVLIQTACRNCHKLRDNPGPVQYGPLRAPAKKKD